MSFESDYLQATKDILDKGTWCFNERTGTWCKALFNVDFEYDVEAPLLTTKRCYPVSAVAEMIGYLRGYTDASDFEAIGAKTWHKNANENVQWLHNHHRKGFNDTGKIYGAVAKDFGGIDTIRKVFNHIAQGIDDRGEIISFWKPDDFDKGCLRPCMYDHHFVVIGDTINLRSTQRSGDFMLGVPFNAIQCWFLLNLAAKVSGKKVGKCTHKVTNAHIYDVHMNGVEELLSREPSEDNGSIVINPWVESFEDVLDKGHHAREYITVSDYNPQPTINFEMIA